MNNVLSYLRLCLWLLIFTVLPGNWGCSDTSDTDDSVSDAAGQAPWSRIELIERYTFDRRVLEDEDLSGIAFASETHGLIGSDECREVQTIELSVPDKTLNIGRTIRLVDSGEEIDIEAMAADDRFYYVIGSHGAAKTTGEIQINRFRVFRVPAHNETGTGAVETADLAAVLSADPVLGPHFRMPLQRRGVNIEGLAVRNGQLFVGLRNPNLNGRAFVLEISAQDIFARKPEPPYSLHRVVLGVGLGIRSLTAVSSGFLIIAGNAGSEPSDRFPMTVDYDRQRGFDLYHWDGKSTAAGKIGSLPDAPAKAEAMAVLAETPASLTVLILFDGVAGGAPSVYRIQ